MLQENLSIKSSIAFINAQDISLVIRFIVFLISFSLKICPKYNIIELIYDFTDDFIYEHIDHIINNIYQIQYLLAKLQQQQAQIKKQLNTIIKNNTIENLGMAEHILLLCTIEILDNKSHTHLILKDYFVICNIFNVPTKTINLLNKIIKLYTQKYNI